MKFVFALFLACMVAVSFAQGPDDCDFNERWRLCKTDQTCAGILAGGPPFLPPPRPCVAGCRCRGDRVRDWDLECVYPEECAPQPCDDPNAIRVPCSNRCPGGTCSRPGRPVCTIPCEVNGCECPPGWLKLSSSDPICVPRELCGLRRGEAGLSASSAEDDIPESSTLIPDIPDTPDVTGY